MKLTLVNFNLETVYTEITIRMFFLSDSNNLTWSAFWCMVRLQSYQWKRILIKRIDQRYIGPNALFALDNDTKRKMNYLFNPYSFVLAKIAQRVDVTWFSHTVLAAYYWGDYYSFTYNCCVHPRQCRMKFIN